MIKVIELIAGIGSQREALKRANIEHEIENTGDLWGGMMKSAITSSIRKANRSTKLQL